MRGNVAFNWPERERDIRRPSTRKRGKSHEEGEGYVRPPWPMCQFLDGGELNGTMGVVEEEESLRWQLEGLAVNESAGLFPCPRHTMTSLSLTPLRVQSILLASDSFPSFASMDILCTFFPFSFFSSFVFHPWERERDHRRVYIFVFGYNVSNNIVKGWRNKQAEFWLE